MAAWSTARGKSLPMSIHQVRPARQPRRSRELELRAERNLGLEESISEGEDEIPTGAEPQEVRGEGGVRGVEAVDDSKRYGVGLYRWVVGGGGSHGGGR